MRKFLFTLGIFISLTALAAENALQPKKQNWSFSGPFGTFDRAAAQRGFQIFQEVCSSCHSLNLIHYRQLSALGFSKEEIKIIAAEHEIEDGPNDAGEMFRRSAEIGDLFFKPYPNEQAARSSNGGSYPIDLSLITKARFNGPNYLYSILVGYVEPPEGITIYPGKHYNPYFPGRQISMPRPLVKGQVSYSDGTEASLEQMAHDVTVFLAWASEPEMEERKRLGIQILISLLVLLILLFFVKKSVWSDVK